jgi:hypothetical protein
MGKKNLVTIVLTCFLTFYSAPVTFAQLFARLYQNALELDILPIHMSPEDQCSTTIAAENIRQKKQETPWKYDILDGSGLNMLTHKFSRRTTLPGNVLERLTPGTVKSLTPGPISLVKEHVGDQVSPGMESQGSGILNLYSHQSFDD